jgi:hypothetical protein
MPFSLGANQYADAAKMVNYHPDAADDTYRFPPEKKDESQDFQSNLSG